MQYYFSSGIPMNHSTCQSWTYFPSQAIAVWSQIQKFALITTVFVSLAFVGKPDTATASAAAVVKKFKIRDLKSKTLYYTGTETHEETGKDIKRTTEYFRAGEGTSIQKEVVIVDKQTLKASSYTFHNNESGEDFVLTTVNDKVSIDHIKEKDAKVSNYALNWDAETIIGRSIHELIIKHWDKLMNNQDVVFTMIIPYRGDSFKFVLKKHLQQDKQVVFRLEPKSWIIRAIAAAMDFHYKTGEESTNPIFLRYEGPAPILINGKKEQVAEMVFE